MRTTLIAGAMAVAFWGTGALADDTTTSTSKQSTEVKTQSTTPPPSSTGMASPQPQETDRSTQSSDNDSSASNLSPTTPPNSGTGGSSEATYQSSETQVTQTNSKPEEHNKMRGLTLQATGGVEGYTGALAPKILPGPSYGVTAVLKPTRVLGIELGYSGAVNNLNRSNGSVSAGEMRGPDIVRNGAQALASFGLVAAPFQPYVAAGVGFDHYDVRAPAAGFRRSDNSGSIPVGVGLRAYIGSLTADARAGYTWLFNSNFSDAPQTTFAGISSVNTGRWLGTLSLGGTF